MPFGKRRYDRVLLLMPGPVPHARFLPLDLSAPHECLTEEQLRVAITTNAYCPDPLPDDEEKLGLIALELFAKNHANPHPTKSALAKRTRDAKKGA